MPGLEIDWEAADKLTLAVLVDHLAMIKDDVHKHENEGSWMHPDDLEFNKSKLIPALEVLIPYFGGELQ